MSRPKPVKRNGHDHGTPGGDAGRARWRHHRRFVASRMSDPAIAAEVAANAAAEGVTIAAYLDDLATMQHQVELRGAATRRARRTAIAAALRHAEPGT